MVLKEDARAFYLSHAGFSLNEPKSSEVLYPALLKTLLFEELSPNLSNGSFLSILFSCHIEQPLSSQRI